MRIDLHLWDSANLYVGSLEADKFGALPPRSTPTAPPETTGEQVAQWAGSRWVVLESRPAAPAAVVGPAQVDAERDRRISAGFEFAGVRYQSRLPQDGKAGDWEVFSGKALEALMAVLNGSQPGDLRWSDPAEDFAWIAADNSRVPMDAQTVIELAKAASAHRGRHTFAGSDLKQMTPIPADYTDDQWWP